MISVDLARIEHRLLAATSAGLVVVFLRVVAPARGVLGAHLDLPAAEETRWCRRGQGRCGEP